MNTLLSLLAQSAAQVWVTFTHNWMFLLVSVVVAVLLKLYADPARVTALLSRHRGLGVAGATLAAVATPLCSCGTTAVVLGMMASMTPWAPVVAFMVASPLTSPEELIYSAGLFGWPFALTFFAASILLGLLGGAAAAYLDGRGWLKGQSRFAAPQPACGCSQPQALQACCCEVDAGFETCDRGDAGQPRSCSQPPASSRPGQADWRRIGRETLETGGRLLAMFGGFAFIGYFLNGLIPAAWIEALFGSGQVYSVPLAATLGLPLYINSEASLPLVRALLDNGMSQGAALAFLITGSGTSLGAVAGALTIARWKVVALVVGVLWLGGILAGAAFNLLA